MELCLNSNLETTGFHTQSFHVFYENLKFTLSFGTVNKGLPFLMKKLCWKMCTDGENVLPCVR